MSVGFTYFNFQAGSGFPYERVVLRSYRSYIAKLIQVIDPITCPVGYLPYIARLLGYNLKFEDFDVGSDEEYKKRIQVKELMKWYALKGTTRSFKYIFEVIRGTNLSPELAWVQVKDGVGIIADPRDTTVWLPLEKFIGRPTIPTADFSITNVGGVTYRYQWGGVGEDPDFFTHMYVGVQVHINGSTFAAGNNGTFVVVGLDPAGHWFDVLNPVGSNQGLTIPGENTFIALNEWWVPDSRYRLDLTAPGDITNEQKDLIMSRVDEVKPQHLIFDFTQNYFFRGVDGEFFEFGAWPQILHNHDIAQPDGIPPNIYHDEGTQDPDLYHVMQGGSDVAAFREKNMEQPPDNLTTGQVYGNWLGVA